MSSVATITAVGAVANSAYQSEQARKNQMDAPQLGATRYPGAVSSPYGSMVYDPVTGGTRYIQNTNQGSYNPSSYQDASLYDALMGGNSASSGLSQQMQQQQLMLDQLKAKGGGKQPTYQDFGIILDPKTGAPINYQDYINKRGSDNPLWERFMKDTGGNYGSDNPDISFGKWAKDVANKEQSPALQSYKNALKTYESNSGAANDAIQQQQLQLDQMKAMAGDQGSAQAGISTNPLMMALKKQEDEANSPYYLKAMNAQTQGTYDNQLQGQEQALAARGLGSSGLGEMTRARMGLQLGNQFNQNALAANQMTTDKQQAALNNRMNMMNYLSGRKDAAFNQGMQQQQLGMQQVGLGSNYGMQNISNASQRDVAQTGLNSQYNLANQNLNMNSANNQSRNWASALGGIGAGIAGSSWGGSGDSTTTNAGTGLESGYQQPLTLPKRETY